MGGEDSDKIVRDSGDTLTIKLTEDEEKYRAKYLPDPRNLTDEKLVCTVCSLSLANDIHRGKTVYVHRALKVLVCEVCFNFYGDGCFSTDEDGDDKYCRWCGQGGTLFLCSACNCAFCQKCVKQNLKASVLADLENDDWKCYFCNPRPLFGCRTICWGALELNKIGIEKEKEKLRKQRERLEKMEERKREEGQKSKKRDSSSEDEQSIKKRKSRARTSSSPEVMPTKKTRSAQGSGHMNGSIDRAKKKRRDSSLDDSSDNKTVTSRSRSRSTKTKSYVESSSENESSMKSKTKLRKKKSQNSSDESSEEDRKKSRRKSAKKKTDTSDDESFDEKPVKRKRPTRKKKNESDSSSDNKQKKKRSRKKRRDTSTDDESSEDRKRKLSKVKKTKPKESSCEDSDNETKKDKKKALESRKRNEESDESNKERKHNLEKYINDDKIDIKLKTNEDTVDNALMKKRIKLAVLWLSATVKDIAELGTLISIRASKFGKKKINLENLKTYDDVLTAVSKLKQLISGIHSNYDHIEKSLDAHLKPWKVLTGLEEPESEKPVAAEDCTNASKVDIKEEGPSDEPSEEKKGDVSLSNTKIVESNNVEAEKTLENDDMVFQWSGLSADEDSGDEKVSTKALISKANETLDKEEKEEKEADKTVKEPTADLTKTGDESTPSNSQEMSQINELSQSVLKETAEQDDAENTEKTCDEDAMETSQEDVQKTEDKKNSSDSKKQDDGSDTDMFDNKESSSVETNIADVSHHKKSENEKRIHASSTESPLKRKSELKGIKTACRKSTNVNQEVSSDDALDSFAKKLKNKWQPKENMKLKTSLGIDSSGDSDEEAEVKKDEDKNIVQKKESREKDQKKENKLNNEGKHKEKDKKQREIKQTQAELETNKERHREKVNKTLKHRKQTIEDRKNTLTSDSECEDIQKDKNKISQNKIKNDDCSNKTGKKESNKSERLKDDKKNEIKDKRKNSPDVEKKEVRSKKYKEEESPTEKVPFDKNKDKKQSSREKEDKKVTLSSDDSEGVNIPKARQESKNREKLKKEHRTKLKNIVSDKKNDNTTEKSKKGNSDKNKGKEEIKKYKSERDAKKTNLSSDNSEVEDIPKDKQKSKETEKLKLKHNSLNENDDIDVKNKSKRENKLQKLNDIDKEKKINKKKEKKKYKTEKDVKMTALSSDDSEFEDIPKQQPKKEDKKTLSDDSEIEDIPKDKQESKETEKSKQKDSTLNYGKNKSKHENKVKQLRDHDHDKNKKKKKEMKKYEMEKEAKKTLLSNDDSEVEDIPKEKANKKASSNDIEIEDIQKIQQESKETLKIKIKVDKLLKNDDIDEKNKDRSKKDKLKNEDHHKRHKRKEDTKIRNRESEIKPNILSSDDSEVEDIQRGKLEPKDAGKMSIERIENHDVNRKRNKTEKEGTTEINANVMSEKNNKIKEVKKQQTQEAEGKKETSDDSESESIQNQIFNTNHTEKDSEGSLTENKTSVLNKNNKNKIDITAPQSDDSIEKMDHLEKNQEKYAEYKDTDNNMEEDNDSDEASEKELTKQKASSDEKVEDSFVQNEKHNSSFKTNNSIAEKIQKDNSSNFHKEIDTDSNKSVEEAMVVCPEISSIKTKFVGLSSSSEDEIIEDNPDKKTNLSSSDENNKTAEKSKTKEKSLKKRSELNKKRSINLVCLDSSDEEEDLAASPDKKGSVSEDEDDKKKKKKSDRSPSPFNLSSGDSSDSEIIISRKRKKKSSSDSDFSAGEDEKIKKDSKKRRRVKMADSSEEGSDEENVKSKKRKSSVGESPGKGGGRKNIKKIKGKDDLAEATKEAAEEEKERRRRVEERQKLFNQVFEVKEAHVLDKLVLDFDPKEKKELLSVDTTLVSKMKPHQAKGVKFMWDSCFESLSDIKKTKGSGCILAHCMGLGKTFQVISLVHTLLTNEEETGVHTIMVVCPLSTVLNWYNEFDKWLQDVENGSDIEVFHLTKCKQNPERARELRRWQHNGGVLIMGYEMFRNLATENNKKFRAKMKKDFQETLVDPGADLIVCDEGHMLKNEQTALSKAMNRVKTLRRIVLTGTPMQNNLNEYHCMVQFVKPNLLGTRKEFLNRFVNPITNGQFVDSTDGDVKIMKRRAHVLHKMLEGLVQRFDYNVLTPFLPPKHEYVVSICLSELQIKLYQHYLQHYSQQSENNKGGARLFQDWQALGRIWTHPRVLKLSSDKANWLREKKAMEESDSEGSLREFIDDGSEAETTPDESDNSSFDSDKSVDGGKKNSKLRNKANTRSTRSNPKNIALLESSEDENEKKEEQTTEAVNNDGEWWSEFIEPQHLDDMNHSGKLVMLFGILKESEMIEDKVLVFSQSLFSLDLIEYFLDKIDNATQEGRLDETLCNHQGNWSKGLDYFRLDGSTSSENRSIWCKSFNREDNPRARLFLISTRAGGLGINLTAANRVIIFDASWNPSHDVQSIFRIYRFGQKKPCYVYRFIAHGTMEEKVYDRQVAKQSISNRVVDEQQVHRHFSSNDLNELYSFTPPTKKEDRPIPALPKDVLFAEILKQFSDWIEKYHEHDSLLENVIEEELNEEERKLAWEDYENDKKRGFMPTTTNTSGTVNPMSYQIEYLRQQLKAQYPEKSEQELNHILVYQVSELMRRQQQMALQQMQQQNMGMVGNVRMPMAQGSMAPFGMQQRMPQMQQQNAITDYQKQMQAQYQLRQMQLQQQQSSALRAQLSQQQSMLRSHLAQPSTTNRPAPTTMPQFALERMMQNYQASNLKSSSKTSNNPSKPPT